MVYGIRRWKIYGSGQGFLTLEIAVVGRKCDIGFPFDFGYMIGFEMMIVRYKWVTLYVVFQFGSIDISLIYIYWPSLDVCFRLQ